MRPTKRILVMFLLMVATVSAVTAKTDLPVAVDCSQTGGGNAKVVVKFLRPASRVTVTVAGTGSVAMETTVSSSASVAADGTVVVNAPYIAGSTAGGLAISVQADFGKGREAQATSYQLVKPSAAETVRGKTGKSGKGGVTVLPAKTTVKP